MSTSSNTMAQQVAAAIVKSQTIRTGHAPGSVTAVLNDDTLVVTLRDALSPAEISMSQTVDGAQVVREFHRRLFDCSVDALRREIARITGVPILEAAVEIETSKGTVVHAFSSGTMVQVFRLAKPIAHEAWNAKDPRPNSETVES